MWQRAAESNYEAYLQNPPNQEVDELMSLAMNSKDPFDNWKDTGGIHVPDWRKRFEFDNEGW